MLDDLPIHEISVAVTMVGTIAPIVALRHTPKLPEPPITPTSTTILGASLNRDIKDLHTFHPGMRRMGFDR